MSKTVSGIFFVLLAALCWGTLGPVAKFATDVDPVDLGLLRALTGGICFFLHALVTKQLRVARKDIPVFIIFSIFGVACFFAVYQAAIPRVGAGMASILLYTAPAWVALLSVLFLKEKLTCIKTISLALCMVGAGMACFAPGGQFDGLGILFGLAAGFTYSLHYLFGKTYLKDYSAITLYAWVLPLGFLFLLCYQGFPNIWSTFTINTSVSSVALWHGVVTTYAAYFFYCKGLERLEATRVSVIATMEPIFAIFLGWFFWSENLGTLGYIGAALVVVGVLLSSKQEQA